MRGWRRPRPSARCRRCWRAGRPDGGGDGGVVGAAELVGQQVEGVAAGGGRRVRRTAGASPRRSCSTVVCRSCCPRAAARRRAWQRSRTVREARSAPSAAATTALMTMAAEQARAIHSGVVGRVSAERRVKSTAPHRRVSPRRSAGRRPAAAAAVCGPPGARSGCAACRIRQGAGVRPLLPSAAVTAVGSRGGCAELRHRRPWYVDPGIRRLSAFRGSAWGGGTPLTR